MIPNDPRANRPASRAPEPNDWWALALFCLASLALVVTVFALCMAWPLL